MLKAADLGKVGSIVNANVIGVSEANFGEDEKFVLELSIKGKTESEHIALNKTNLATMLNSFGDETLEWVGKAIELRVENTLFKGQKTVCIRIYPKA